MDLNLPARLVTLMVLFMRQASAQDANCDFNTTVLANQQMYFNSPNYPSNYRAGITCRWIASCPVNYNCRVQCQVNMPQSTNCQLDRLLISRSGDAGLANPDVYCGSGNFILTSTGNRISTGLLVSPTSPGGRFLCQVTAVAPTTVPTPECNCGYKKTNRIVGGVETGVNEYTSMGGLYNTQIYQIKCGCVIISERHCLTAGHCLIGHTTRTMQLVVGEHNININDSPATKWYILQRLLIHPLFNENTYNNDIGLVYTVEAIGFSDRVGPVCLPFVYQASGETFAGKNVTVPGWGTQFPGGPTSDVLLKVVLDVISNSVCRSSISTVTDSQMCTRTPGKDACQDDSGGPLYYTSPAGVLYSAGIVSSGQFCASLTPSINTRTTSHMPWILANTPGVEYCRK